MVEYIWGVDISQPPFSLEDVLLILTDSCRVKFKSKQEMFSELSSTANTLNT